MSRDARMARLDPLVQRMYAYYQTGKTLAEVGEKHGRDLTTVAALFKTRGLKCRSQHTPVTHARIAATRRAKSAALIAQMHADYMAPMSMRAVAAKYDRAPACIREFFRSRGLFIRPAKIVPRQANGSPVRYVPMTAAQIEALLAGATKLKVPDELKFEWRLWAMPRRRDFIHRLRSRLASPNDAPAGEYSDNVDPFEYGHPRAHAIADQVNAGHDSRQAAQKIKICSQGVIYRDQLWFWNRSLGCGYQLGAWTEVDGRPILHHVLWVESNGRPVPPGHVVRHADGNRNNFDPANLVLATRNDVCRENQAQALTKQSRATTALLLARAQTNTRHANTDTILHLRRR